MMMEAITTIFGEYTPVVYTLADGTITTGVNWAYVASVLIFSICLYSALRILGTVFKR